MSESATPFKFVIVGTGNIATTYCTAVEKISGAEITGIISRSGRIPANAPKNVSIAPDLEAMERDFDAVIIATPNGLHHVAAIAAANLKKHVLTEKPLDITIEAMDQMITACNENNVRLGVAYQQRTSILNKAVKQIITEGSLGRIFAADLEIRCWRDQAYYDSASYRGNKAVDGGGPFIQQGAHGIDLYAWFFGKPEKTLSLLGTFCHDIEGEDHGVAILKHSNGMIGSIIASTAAYPGFPQRLTVHCEKGSFIIENNAVKFWNIKGVDQPSLQSTYTHTGASSAAVADTSGHETIIKDFIDAVKHGRPPLVSGEDARVATEIILDIYSGNQY